MMEASRRRTREGHVAAARAAQVELSEDYEEVGDMTITGDIQIGPKEYPKEELTATTEPAEQVSSVELKPTSPTNGTGKLIAAALAGAGVPLLLGLGYLIGNVNDSPMPIDTDTANTIRPDDQP